MASKGALVLFAAGGLALIKGLRDRERAKYKNLTGSTGALQQVRQQAVDLNVVMAAAGGVAPLTSSTAITQSSVNKVMTTAVVVGAVLSALGSVLSALIDVAIGAPYVWIAVAVVLIVMGFIFFEFGSDNSHRIKYAIKGMYGSRFTLNRFEFATCEAWLKSLNCPYQVQQVRDDWIKTQFYEPETNTTFNRYADRYVIQPQIGGNNGLSQLAWNEMQLFARCAAIDYFKRVAKYLDGTYINVQRKIGEEVPVMVPGMPRSTYLPSNGPAWKPFFQAASPVPNDPSNGFNEAWRTPLIGDATKYYLKNADPATGYTSPLDNPNYGAKSGASFAPTFDAAISRWAGSAPWLQMQLNNHFTAIASALAVYKLNPSDTQSANWSVLYGYHMWMGSWLSETDHITVDGSLLHYDKDYWGWEIILDAVAFKSGRTGAFKIVGRDGKIVNLSFDTPVRS